MAWWPTVFLKPRCLVVTVTWLLTEKGQPLKNQLCLQKAISPKVKMFFSKNHKPRINEKKLFSHASNSTLNLNYSSKKCSFMLLFTWLITRKLFIRGMFRGYSIGRAVLQQDLHHHLTSSLSSLTAFMMGCWNIYFHIAYELFGLRHARHSIDPKIK